ncbi:unnamed protein product [Lupinus luteus]|uniref:Uncharacterized protein n=1 Tax=Lupinus luteus TaxID=3873 RepID=A0AAV1X3D0_LUPLU
MPFPMKIQPIDFQLPAEGTRLELAKPVVKSRLKRLLERQFSGVLRNPAVEKIAGEEQSLCKDGVNCSHDFEPSTVCLTNMVHNFIEENPEKHSVSTRCGRNRCNCFNRNSDDNSDNDSDDFSDSNYSPSEACEILKGMVACASVFERNLLADTAKIVDNNNKICKRKDSYCRKIVTESLLSLGYDASICKSRWEKSPSCPAGEYEYIDVILGKERVLLDIDFKSEFEIARSTKTYKTILQNLPYIFVGKCDRLQSIVGIVSEAVKQSLKKKGMHVPPWRRAEYVRAKWLSPYTRATPPKMENLQLLKGSNCVESQVCNWKPPELKNKGSVSGVKVVTGFAAVSDIDNE